MGIEFHPVLDDQSRRAQEAAVRELQQRRYLDEATRNHPVMNSPRASAYREAVQRSPSAQRRARNARPNTKET